MAYWSIPAGQQIDYSANGDDIDSFSQKVKWCLEEIFNSLQYLHTNGSTGDIDAPAQAYEIRVDSSNGTLCIRNAANNDWITLGKLEEHFGIEPEDIGAIRNGGGIKKLDMGNLTVIDLNAEPLETYSTGDVYISAKDKAVYWFTGSTWKTIVASGDGDDILTKSILVNQGSQANVGKVLKINEHGKLSTDITGSPGMLYDKAIVRRGELKNNQVLVYDSTENGNAGAFVNREIDAVVGGGITGGGNDCVVGGLSGELLFIYGGTSSIYKRYDGKDDISVDVTKCIVPLTIIQGNDTISYDGSYGHVVRIPSDRVLKDLAITENGTTRYYNGSSSMAITIPSSSQYGHDLKFNNSEGTELGKYNGTRDLSIQLQPLTITQGTATIKYDCSAPKTVTVPSVNAILTIKKNSTTVTYNGTENSSINLTNNNLIVRQKGKPDIQYDGSATQTVTLPSDIVGSLTISQGQSSISYNGSASQAVSLPAFPLPALTIKQTGSTENSVTYNGTSAATFNIASINRSTEIFHLKRLFMLFFMRQHEYWEPWTNFDGVWAFRFTGDNSGFTNCFDSTSTTLTFGVYGMMLNSGQTNGTLVSNRLSTGFDTTRRADVFVWCNVSASTSELKASIAFDNGGNAGNLLYYDGTATLSSTERFLPMNLYQKTREVKEDRDVYLWHFTYLVQDTGFSLNRATVKLTLTPQSPTGDNSIIGTVFMFDE